MVGSARPSQVRLSPGLLIAGGAAVLAAGFISLQVLFALGSQPAITWLTIGANIAAIVAAVVAVYTVRQVAVQGDLVRQQVFGELYDEAQIRNLEFYLPEKQKHLAQGFESEQKQVGEVRIGDTIHIPQGTEVELHVHWWMAQSQTLRHISYGFLDEYKGAHFGFDKTPKMRGGPKPFAKKVAQRLPREEYEDWHGHFHTEYGHPRRLPKDECMVIACKVKGREKGNFPFAVEITVMEAPRPYRGLLRVVCQ